MRRDFSSSCWDKFSDKILQLRKDGFVTRESLSVFRNGYSPTPLVRAMGSFLNSDHVAFREGKFSERGGAKSVPPQAFLNLILAHTQLLTIEVSYQCTTPEVSAPGKQILAWTLQICMTFPIWGVTVCLKTSIL